MARRPELWGLPQSGGQENWLLSLQTVPLPQRIYLEEPLGLGLLTSGVFMMSTPAIFGCSRVCWSGHESLSSLDHLSRPCLFVLFISGPGAGPRS